MCKDSTKKTSIEDKALDAFTEVMIKHLESIEKGSNWQKPWFCDSAMMWPCNLEGKGYNGGNAFILAMLTMQSKWKYPIFVTSAHLDEFNGKKDPKTKKFTKAVDKDGNPLPVVHVTKGEHSFPVMFYSPYYKDADGKYVSFAQYQEMSKAEREKLEKKMTNRIYFVFNIDQTNLAEARPKEYKKLIAKINPQIAKTKEETTEEGMFEFPAVDSMIRAQKWVCPITLKYGDDAYYSMSKDAIVMPEKKQFKNGESFYGNLFHEMSHSTGAEKRIGRLHPDKFGSAAYASEELIAELSAALVGMKYGIEKNIKEDSIPYLKNWLGSLKQSPQYIKGIMSDVKKAASMVCEHIDIVQTAIDNGERFDTTIEVETPEVVVEEGVAAKGI